jgi:hypothetical protein
MWHGFEMASYPPKKSIESTDNNKHFVIIKNHWKKPLILSISEVFTTKNYNIKAYMITMNNVTISM